MGQLIKFNRLVRIQAANSISQIIISKFFLFLKQFVLPSNIANRKEKLIQKKLLLIFQLNKIRLRSRIERDLSMPSLLLKQACCVSVCSFFFFFLHSFHIAE